MRRAQSSNAFTLVEVLISTALAAVLMAGVLTTFVFLGRSLARLANYQVLEAKAREGLAYLRADLAQAKDVKGGTTPTASTVTLELPSGDVTYTYDSSAGNLRRQANYGANRDFYLLQNDHCSCTTFTFDFFTTTRGATTSQITPGLYVPYSIKQLRIRFILQTPGTESTGTRASYEAVSSRFYLRAKPAPDGS